MKALRKEVIFLILSMGGGETNLIFSSHIFKILHFNLYQKWIISIIFISIFNVESFWNWNIVPNGAALPFKNLLSINKFWENGEVFLNFSTFCWCSDFLSIVSLILSCSCFVSSNKKKWYESRIIGKSTCTLMPHVPQQLHIHFTQCQ